MFDEAPEDSLEPTQPRLAVVAMGGNALLPSNELGTPADQVQAARRISGSLLALLRGGRSARPDHHQHLVLCE